MQYASMMYCEHANACPTSVCRCPENCGCRELMCKPEPAICVARRTCTEGQLRFGTRLLATFDCCQFWADPGIRGHAWLIPELELAEDTVRDIVAGKLPILLFNGIEAKLEARGVLELSFRTSMVWGNFMLYETGEPVIRNFVGVPDVFQGLPPPAVVKRVLALMKVPKIPL